MYFYFTTAAVTMEKSVSADEEPPKAHTYSNWGKGYSSSNEFPPLVLESVNVPIVSTAPDMAGTWKVTEVFGSVTGRKIEGEEDEDEDETDDTEEHTAGWPLDHPHVGFTQRIEQAGNRVVITTAAPRNVIHDMVCDGSIENGVFDVSGIDLKTHIQATAEYVNDQKHGNMHVMRPVTTHLKRITRRFTVKRWREGAKLIWKYGFYVMHMERVEGDGKNVNSSGSMESSVDDINSVPKKHTYDNYGCGYPITPTSEFPPLALGHFKLPLVPEAPDIRGLWKIVKIENRVLHKESTGKQEGWPIKHPPRELWQRIEQAGNRVVITTGGTIPPHRVIHDMICDESIEGCADDVSGKDQVTRIRATGKFIEDDRGKVHVLMPMFNNVDVNIPGVEVERWLEGNQLVWKYGLYQMYCEQFVEGEGKDTNA